MRYSTIRKIDISNGPYIGVSLFLQGCNFHCKNCFNQITWPLDGGYKWTPEVEEQFLNLIGQEGVKRVSILGGEPMIQADELSTLLEKIKKQYPDKEIWLWTGFYVGELEEPGQKKVLDLCDFIVDGRFVDELKNPELRFKGSTNQTIWTKDSEGHLVKSKYD
jgi:anaerobic ribonucleoside-triphosphate reductase activating protein